MCNRVCNGIKQGVWWAQSLESMGPVAILYKAQKDMHLRICTTLEAIGHLVYDHELSKLRLRAHIDGLLKRVK